MRGSEFIFNSVDTLYYNLNKIMLSRGASYIDFPKWLKNKKTTINLKNNDEKCFQYTLTVALNYENIKINRERISEIKPFIDKYNWKERDFPSYNKDRKFKSNNTSSSLSNLVDNLSEGLHCDKCTDCESCLDCIMFKDDRLIFRFFECKKNIKKDFNKELIKRFANIYEFCNKDINKSILLLRNGVYPYEYMDSWEKFDETSLPDKEAFYSSLNMEDITDADHSHVKIVFKEFHNKNLGDWHDLYVKSYTLVLADVFENFRNKCIEVYELDPVHFLSAPGLAWQACLKKTEVNLELLTDNDMLLMVEKEIRGGICHAIHSHAKANNKYIKNYDKNKESSSIEYLDANNLYGEAMSQKLPVDGFKWIKTSLIDKKFNKFIKLKKTVMKIVIKYIFLK